MNTLKQVYTPSLVLATDLYELTMAYGYWKNNMENHQAVFHAFFRKNPFEWGCTVTCGLEFIIDYLSEFKFSSADLNYLAKLRGKNGSAMFEAEFLEYLSNLKFSCDIDALPEGTVAFPNAPILRVNGPLPQAQLIETFILNTLNFQSLIATKAARIVQSAQDDTVLEFGLRRAQGIDGGLSASRAAFIGGVSATSNVMAGEILGIPVRGTHAHSWIMSFEDEMTAFKAYADAMPHNCTLLVDTYNTIQGVKNAAEIGREMKKDGKQLAGIRLDSGDLAYLSIEARKILNDAGLEDANIIASNDLDEYIIKSLKEQGAKIDIWGVGTKLVTSYDQAALGGVYKLAAIKTPKGEWENRIKLSEQTAKISTPSAQQVRRFTEGEFISGDIVYSLDLGITEPFQIIDPKDSLRRKIISPQASYKDLLVPIFRNGEQVYQTPNLTQIQKHVKNELNSLHPGIRRFEYPHEYPVGLDQQLHDLKMSLVLKARGWSI